MTRNPVLMRHGKAPRHVLYDGALIDYDLAVRRMDKDLFRAAYKAAARAARKELLKREKYRHEVAEFERRVIEMGYDPGPPPPPDGHVKVFEEYLKRHRRKYRKAFAPGLPQVNPTPEELAYWRHISEVLRAGSRIAG